MLQTDEGGSQLEMQRFMIYWLIYKLGGGEFEFNFTEMMEFFNDPQVRKFVKDTDHGLALKVYRPMTQGDLDAAFE